MKTEIEQLQNIKDVIKSKLLTATAKAESDYVSALTSVNNAIYFLNKCEQVVKAAVVV